MRGLSSSRAVGAEGAGLDALDTDAMSDSTRRELGMLKKSFHDMASQLERASKASPGIDWKSFEGKVDAGTLKVFKGAVEGFSAPDYKGTEAEEAAAAFSKLLKTAETQAAESAKRVTEIEAELAGVRAEREALASKTVDEVLAAEPELAKKIDAEISESKWY